MAARRLFCVAGIGTGKSSRGGLGTVGLAELAVLKEGGSHRTQLWEVQATPAFASVKGGTGPSNGLVPFIE